MATKTKHMARSRRSSHSTIPTQMFESKAKARQTKKESKGFLEKILNQTTNK